SRPLLRDLPDVEYEGRNQIVPLAGAHLIPVETLCFSKGLMIEYQNDFVAAVGVALKDRQVARTGRVQIGVTVAVVVRVIGHVIEQAHPADIGERCSRRRTKRVKTVKVYAVD